MRALILCLLLAASPALAVQPDEVLPDPALEARARQISHDLRCPVCQGETIDDSNAPISRDLRLLVRERLVALGQGGELAEQAVRHAPFEKIAGDAEEAEARTLQHHAQGGAGADCGDFTVQAHRIQWPDIDHQAGGPQAVTVEDSFSMIHASYGQLEPLSAQMRSEPAIIAGIAKATLGNHPVDWDALIADYRRIRELIADTIPGFSDFNQRLQHPGGFYLGNAAAERRWLTASHKANFKANPLPADLLPPQVRSTGQTPDLILQTLRSHDQYNTTIYGLDDRYRGVKGQRQVLFVNEADILRLGFQPGQQVDIQSIWDDGIERKVVGFTLLAFDIPAGQAAAYYPEANPLVPLQSFGAGSFTPTSKYVAIRLQAHQATARIL